MTDEQRERQRALKRETAARLADIWASPPQELERVLDTDTRLADYCGGVVEHPDEHNLYELLGVLRFFEFADRYRWDSKAVRKFAKFYESLKFNGINGRQRYTLTPVQYYQFANIFGWRDADGRRLTRSVYIFVPRKFSKTTSAAALAVYDMLFGDSNAQAYVAANSYQQAKICFDEIRAIMMGIDPSGRVFRVNREQISYNLAGHSAFIRCLSGNAKTQDGLNASLVIMDEYAQARDTATKSGADLKNTLTSSMGARREPLTVVITTASDVLDGAFAKELDGAKAVLRGELINDSLFASLFMPDVDDREDDPATWRKVQPHLGITVQPDFYRHEWEQAQLSADNMMVYRTKLLNIFAQSERERWIDDKLIAKISQPLDVDDFGGLAAYLAIDLSRCDDLTAVTTAILDREHGRLYYINDYFFPAGALSGHPDRALFAEWGERGAIHLTDGDIIDYRDIVEHINRTAQVMPVHGIAYDAWGSVDLGNYLRTQGMGDILFAVPQSYGYFTAPLRSFERWAKEGRVVLADNPITRWCFGNCVLDTDSQGQQKPYKAAHNLKIDGVITILMATRQILYIST